MYAIIEDSGTQFKVTSGDRIRIDRSVKEDVKNITFDKVLLVGGEGSPKIGAPLISGATVTADVLGVALGRRSIFRSTSAARATTKRSAIARLIWK